MIDSFAVNVLLAQKDSAANGCPSYSVYLKHIHGGAGAAWWARFAAHSPELHYRTTELFALDNSRHDDTIQAEVVHTPKDRLLNVLARPHFHAWEISIMDRSTLPTDHQIALRDLRLQVSGERLELWSESLNRRVAPRLSHAHYVPGDIGVPAYELLYALALQDGQPILWSVPGGPMAFVPRFWHGDTVLSLATWTVDKEEIVGSFRQPWREMAETINSWRNSRGIPQLARLTVGDNELPVDFRNPLSIQSFVRYIEAAETAILQEFFPLPQELPVQNKSGHFSTEIVVPFLASRTSEASAPSSRRPPALLRPAAPPPAALTSDWLFLKLYCGPSTGDRILGDFIGPAVRTLRDKGLIDQWFFIRYADPDYHLRLRFKIAVGRDVAELLLT